VSWNWKPQPQFEFSVEITIIYPVTCQNIYDITISDYCHIDNDRWQVVDIMPEIGQIWLWFNKSKIKQYMNWLTQMERLIYVHILNNMLQITPKIISEIHSRYPQDTQTTRNLQLEPWYPFDIHRTVHRDTSL
jgi:hypothetical protein